MNQEFWAPILVVVIFLVVAAIIWGISELWMRFITRPLPPEPWGFAYCDICGHSDFFHEKPEEPYICKREDAHRRCRFNQWSDHYRKPRPKAASRPLSHRR